MLINQNLLANNKQSVKTKEKTPIYPLIHRPNK